MLCSTPPLVRGGVAAYSADRAAQVEHRHVRPRRGGAKGVLGDDLNDVVGELGEVGRLPVVVPSVRYHVVHAGLMVHVTGRSDQVRRLEADGLVERLPCPQDARATNARLTDKGWDKVVQAAPGHVGAVRGYVIDRLSRRQIRQLVDIAESALGCLGTQSSLPFRQARPTLAARATEKAERVDM